MKLIEKTYPYLNTPIYQGRLENGLRIVLIPKKDFHETYAIMTVEFGSVDNELTTSDNRKRIYPVGVAHFLEHKLFETADSGDMLHEFAVYGANANAYTSFNQTSYLFSTTGELRRPLELLQKMVREVHFTEESVEREKEIIVQEIEMYADDSDHRLYLGILKGLYPNTSLAEDIAGTRDSIQEISATTLRENFQQFYRPNAMTLVVTGDIDIHEVFGWICDDQAENQGIQEERQIATQVVKGAVSEHGKEYWEVGLPKLAIGLRGNDVIPKGKEQYYQICLSFLLSMLIGRTSKRYQTLYETNKIDHSLSVHIEVQQGYHFVVVTGDTAEPITVSSQLRKAFLNFDGDEDVTQEHFQILKNEMYGEFINGLNSSEFTVGYFVNHFSETESIFDIPELLISLKLEEVLDIGRQFMSQCDVADFIIFPK
ncbi:MULTISPECIES: EF-P 5-aminopentanol modification-associated protein YfmH [unclassified Streptococcus]|uniref:EF-P 5-aminopentanol modification-associated protein YfmH n=1 Tax=unclassified Streptococcus TaxID=2608887 RepID=UPI0010726516|nr:MULTISPECIES: pitrilysin family protein [unclassified Streptococcus]MBF0786922.1 insulinase family protein [Streptococcus sp. 19428wC2_LYSM12]MCQ9211468.1 insulinase family protein [Streptococcus sp. B01]MCQ9214784.1 insulinase family protein [Streptococcus sp. O1]TFV06124.1 insulinase family protein [Streptococcus sp. LYSM12]